MDSLLNNGKTKLASIFTSLKLAIYLSTDKYKVYDRLIALATPTILIGPVVFLALCFLMIKSKGLEAQHFEIAIFIGSYAFLPFWFALCANEGETLTP
ncbi:hypothetical protein D1BOALGB6SA_2500 [Olavius sp. associated proteobacterium Delta 1]|nr:hypothetical protein D1BOALGB6SA_2500 [Olavius sp. associated proteobacterium Delta 1]